MIEEKKSLELSEIKKKLKECEKLKEEYLNGWQHSRADFLNYKKKEEERIGSFLDFVKKNWLLEILNIHDNLERAREHTPGNLKDIEWVKGVLQIENQFHQFFKKQGVKRLEPLGEKFDPSFHEVVEEVELKDKEKGIIIEVIEKGYLVGEKLLRTAKVKISK